MSEIIDKRGKSPYGELIEDYRETLIKEQRQRIAQLERELAATREQRDNFHKWMNCGGAPTGRTCRVDGHEIYGPFFSDTAAGDNTICELHGLRQTIDALRERDKRSRELLERVMAIDPASDQTKVRAEIQQHLEGK